MDQNIISVGIIGFGLSGKVFHAPLLLAHGGYKIKRVVSSRADEIIKLVPETEITQKVEDVLSDPEIDLIINCSPNSFHYSFTRDALQKGKHVVVEKPFINRVSEGEELLSLARLHNRKLSVFHNRRWDSDFLTVKALIEDGLLGDVTEFESHFDRFRPTSRPERWREQDLEGSGVWFDLGSHLVDQSLCLFGMPEKIFADIQTQKAGCADDYFNVILKFGKRRVILKSSSFIENTPRFIISGTKGHFLKFGADPQEEQLKKEINLEVLGRENETTYGKLTSYKNGPSEFKIIESRKGNYLEFYSRLHKCILDPSKPEPVLAMEALNVIRVLHLGLESSKLGCWLNV